MKLATITVTIFSVLVLVFALSSSAALADPPNNSSGIQLKVEAFEGISNICSSQGCTPVRGVGTSLKLVNTTPYRLQYSLSPDSAPSVCLNNGPDGVMGPAPKPNCFPLMILNAGSSYVAPYSSRMIAIGPDPQRPGISDLFLRNGGSWSVDAYASLVIVFGENYPALSARLEDHSIVTIKPEVMSDMTMARKIGDVQEAIGNANSNVASISANVSAIKTDVGVVKTVSNNISSNVLKVQSQVQAGTAQIDNHLAKQDTVIDALKTCLVKIMIKLNIIRA